MAKSRRGTARPTPETAPANRYSLWLLQAAVFLVPLATSNVTWLGPTATALTRDQFDLVKAAVLQVLVAGALAAWVVGQWRTGALKVRWAKPVWLLVAFIGWAALSAALAVHRPTAVFGDYARPEGLIAFVDYALVFLLALNVADRMSAVRALVATLAASSVIVALYGLVQYVGADPLRWGTGAFEAGRVFSTLGNPDMLGGFLVFALVISPTLALSEERTWLRAFWWSATGVVGIAWILTFVRSAWIAGAVGLLLVGFWVVRQRVRLGKGDIAAIAVMGAGAVAVGLYTLRSSSAVTNVVQRAASIVEIGSGSTQERLLLWRGGLAAVAARPVTGWGPGTFRYAFQGFEPTALVRIGGHLGVAIDAHTLPLQVAVGTGVVGAVLLLGFVGWTLVSSLRHLLAGERTPGSLLVGGAWAAAAGYLVYLLLSPSVLGATFALWLLLGLVLSPASVQRSFDSRATLIGAAAAVAVVVIGALWISAATLSADHASQRTLTVTDSVERARAADAAVRIAPWETAYRTSRALLGAEAFYAAERAELQARSSGGSSTALVGEARTLFDSARSEMQQTLAFNPLLYSARVNEAELLNRASALWGNDLARQAEQTSRDALAIRPAGADAMLQLGLAQANQGDLGAASASLRKAIALDPGFADASLQLGRILADQGDVAEARTVLAAALKAPSAGADQALAQIASLLQSLESTATP